MRSEIISPAERQDREEIDMKALGISALLALAVAVAVPELAAAGDGGGGFGGGHGFGGGFRGSYG